MTPLEQETFDDSFRLLLLVSDINPARNSLRFHVRLFEGGMCTDETHVQAAYAGTDDAPYRTLQAFISRVAAEPHVLAGCGSGWFDLLTAFMPEPAIAALRILDLRTTAAAFAPNVKSNTFPDGFAAAFGLSWQASEQDLPVALMEDLTWHLIHMAGTRDLDWPGLLEYATSSRHHAPFERFHFDETSLANIPCQPGIYVMRDRNGATLYVGKSKNLQARVGSYFSSQKTLPSKIKKIWDQIADLEIRLAGSDLEALLMEQQGIEEMDPGVNIQRTVAEGRSRYGTPSTTVVLLLPSSKTARLELFWIGIAGSTYQLRVNPSRPPLAQLTQLAVSAGSDKAPRKASRNLINWGPQGNEIASRVFGRYRTQLTWIETGSVSADAFVERLAALMKKAMSRPLEPAQIRMRDDD